jgi:hypothetical protein
MSTKVITSGIWYDTTDKKFGSRHQCAGARIDIIIGEGGSVRLDYFTADGTPKTKTLPGPKALVEADYGDKFKLTPVPLKGFLANGRPVSRTSKAKPMKFEFSFRKCLEC